MNALVHVADRLAEALHAGQKRRHGDDYITHPREVMRVAEVLALSCGEPFDDDMRATALLHDVLEDSDMDAATLAQRTNTRVADAVLALTKHDATIPADTVPRYYAQLAQAPSWVQLIKVADRCHNLSELHKTWAQRDDTAQVKRAQATLLETQTHVLPLVARAPGLVAALHDAMRAAAFAVGVTPPVCCERPALLGLYAVTATPDVMQAHALAGTSLVQLRDKTADDATLLAALAQMKVARGQLPTRIIINDRADLCVAADVDGVHLGQGDMPVATARALVGERIIGTSTHTQAQWHAALTEGSADYVAVGPVFLSNTKQGHADVVGLDALRQRTQHAPLPVCAIGGIHDVNRVIDAAKAGAALCASVSLFDVPPTQLHAHARRLSLAFFAARATAST